MKQIVLFCFFFLSTTLQAQEFDENRYPTYRLVMETEIPALDRYDLAQRFSEQAIFAPNIANPPERTLGEINPFYIAHSNVGGRWIEAELQVISQHVYLWLEHDVVTSAESLAIVAERFDHEVYEFVRGLWGEENLGIDGENRLHILITAQLPNNLGGFFAATNQFPRTLLPLSNERDLITMNSIVLLPNFQDAAISTAAHEFQHLIHYQRDPNEDVWLSEGFATLTEHLLGLGTPNYLFSAFAGMPSTQLNAWGLTDNRYPSYGAALLYTTYLYERFGLARMQMLQNDSRNGFASVSAIMGSNSDELFADWVLANYLREDSGIYGYSSLPEFPQMSLAAPPIFQLPSIQQRTLNQYSTAYFELLNPPTTVNISLTLPETVRLFPAESSWAWYSLRGDSSNPRLTRAFDLRNLNTATLEYRVWYSLEDNWDYAYITISRDDGVSWEILTSPRMSSENRYGRAYGLGYTGESGAWLDESISLDAFIGSEILLRFEVVTDDSVNKAGIVLDDIRLGDYFSDFEADGGGWLAEGWIRTDNRLPQSAWLQIIEQRGAENIISRHLVRGQGQWVLNLAPETTALSLALSPFAPMTTEPIAYELRIDE